eukprot:3440206-Pyramimonas_sp.AAC.1
MTPLLAASNRSPRARATFLTLNPRSLPCSLRHGGGRAVLLTPETRAEPDLERAVGPAPPREMAT